MKRKAIPRALLLAFLSNTTQVDLPTLKRMNGGEDRALSPEEVGSVISVNFSGQRRILGDRARKNSAA